MAADFTNLSNEARAKAMPLAKTLAASGDKEAQFTLGMLLLESPDHRDVEGAAAALNDAANQDYPDAQVNLAMIYQEGLLKTGPDLVQAVNLLRRAADNGDAKAEFWLGCYYQYGWGGVAKDQQKAFDQYTKAVAGNYRRAQDALEIMSRISKGKSPCFNSENFVRRSSASVDRTRRPGDESQRYSIRYNAVNGNRHLVRSGRHCFFRRRDDGRRCGFGALRGCGVRCSLE